MRVANVARALDLSDWRQIAGVTILEIGVAHDISVEVALNFIRDQIAAEEDRRARRARSVKWTSPGAG